MRAKGISMRQIAIKLKRSPSTISRELRRNAATRGVAISSTGRRRPSGRPTSPRDDPRRRNSLSMNSFARMCRTSCPGFCETTMVRWWARSLRGRAVTSRGEPIAGGQRRGARSRSPADCPSTTPTTSRCGSPTKRSTNPSTSKDAGGRWNGRWWRACGPGGHCASHGLGRRNCAPDSSPTT